MQKKLLITVLVFTSTMAVAQKGGFGVGVQYNGTLPISKTNFGKGNTYSIFYAPSDKSKINLNYTSLTTGFIHPQTGSTDFLHTSYITTSYTQYFGKKKHWFITPELGVELIGGTAKPLAALSAGYAYHTKRSTFEVGLRVQNALNSAAQNFRIQGFVAYKLRLFK